MTLSQNRDERFQLAAIVESSRDAIISITPDGRITRWNSAAERLFGYTAQGAIGQSVMLLVLPQHSLEESLILERIRRGERIEPYETQWQRQDGCRVDVAITVSPIWDEQGTVIGAAKIVRDISAQHRAQQALQEQTAILSSFYNSSPLMMGVVELAENDIFHISDNQATANFFQTTVPALKNQWASHLGASTEQIQTWIKHYRTSQAEQQPVRFEYAHVTNTTTYWLSISVSFIGVGENQRPRFSYVAEDITDRKTVELDLQSTKEQLELVLQASSEGFWDWNLITNEIYFSPQWKAMLGYADHELTNSLSMWESLIFDEDRRAALQMVEDYNSGRVDRFEAVQRFHHRDGSTVYVLSRALHLKNATGQVIRMVGSHLDVTENKRQEFALQESEAALSEAQRMVHLGNWKLDGATRQLTWSEELFRICGTPPQDSPPDYKQSFHYIHPEDRPLLRESIERALGDGTPYEIELRLLRKDGSLRYVEARGHVRRNHQGAIEELFGTTLDITERKVAEIALAASQKRFQNLVENSPDIIERFDLQLRHLYVSPALTKITGLLPQIFLGKTCRELGMDEAMVTAWEAAAARLLETGQKQVIEFETPALEGLRSFEMAIVPELSDQGEIESILCISRDITDRQRVEEDLRRQKEMFQAIVDHIPVMIGLFNDQARIDFLNPEFERTLGWALADWQQSDAPWKLNFDSSSQQNVLDHLRSATGTWKDFTIHTLHQQSLETSWVGVQLSDGRSLGIGQDISDRKRKERALQQAIEAAEAANLAKSMFLANMSHELRTPLNVILGFTQVMAHDPLLTATQLEDLRTIRRSGDHLLSLINDILDLSKIEAGHCNLEEIGFDLMALLHGLENMMSERAAAKGLQLVFEIASGLPQFIVADEQKLRQVLLNLLSNAIKFTQQGRVTLRVTWQPSQDQVPSLLKSPGRPGSLTNGNCNAAYTLQFEVIDTGIGIAPEEQSSIFDAFVQADAGKKSTSGTGLGLAISRRLIELMHGSISVHSRPKGGSKFTVTLTVRSSSEGVAPQSPGDRIVIGLVPGQPDYRILVVDDQRENRLLMVRLLTQIGLQVREAASGQEAIQVWQDWQPDLIWMDIRMPGLNGYETTKQIRSLEQEKASIILALSAQASQADQALALAAGFNGYIHKPFREETVFCKMAEYLGLEYLYTEPPMAVTEVFTTKVRVKPDTTGIFDPSMAACLAPGWLQELEHKTLCGRDQEVIELSQQLPPEMAPVAKYLVELADQFEFEQILDWIRRIAIPKEL